ncbi:MAG TPA: hypothetical protein VJV03_16965 [Pyrinomonadaceae bacterium]|nr:hypothetical protein [Pyrinomonadaceae bacterium]
MAELFENIEVNKDSWWPKLMKLLGGSVGLHLLLLLAVLYVPGLRDAFNLAVLVADASFVDKDYEQTVIGEDIQMVEISGEKFRYPDGYWAAEGQPVEMPAPMPDVPFTAQAAPLTNSFPEPTPSPTPDLSATVIPSPSPVTSASPEPVAQASASPSPSTGAKLSPEEAQKELEKTAKQNNLDLPKEGEINKKALKDFAAYANELKNQGKLDLNKPFEIVIEAELDENGKLKNPKFIKKEGDPNLVELFGRMIAALNDSGFLVYLKPIDKDNPGTKVVFTVKQGESDVLASVESEVSSDSSARVLASAFNTALAIGADSRAGKDEEVLLRNTTASPNGKKLVFNFTMPRQAVVDLIKKQLAAS